VKQASRRAIPIRRFPHGSRGGGCGCQAVQKGKKGGSLHSSFVVIDGNIQDCKKKKCLEAIAFM
jgi:hypothetical protein